MPIHGSAPNFSANNKSCSISSGLKVFWLFFIDLHSMAKYRLESVANMSGDGKGVEPEPGHLRAPKPASQNRWTSSRSALDPFLFIFGHL